MKIKEQINFRLIIVYLGIVFFALLILIQIIYLQNFRKKTLESQAQTTNFKVIEASRGDILSIDGRVLATSVPKYRILMDTQVAYLTDSLFNSEIDSLASCFNLLFEDKTKEEYFEILKVGREKKNRYLLLQEDVSFRDLQLIKTFPLLKFGRYKGGLISEEEFIRTLPHDYLARRTIGYKTQDNRKVGIEGAFDEYLTGRNGFKLMQKISGGSFKELNYKDAIEPVNGIDLISTININIQDIVDKALRKRLIMHNAEYGTAVLMDVKTGEVRAIVNLTKEADSVYVEDFNYAIARLYEPGSTFKLASMMIAFEKGGLELDEIIDTKRGVMKIQDFYIRDHKKGGYGKINIQEVFEHSSNIGVSIIAKRQFKDNQIEFLDRLYSIGFGDKLGIKLKGEVAPQIKYPDDAGGFWSGVSLMQMAQGYELKVTPLQILSLFNAVANNGKLLRPIFVKAFREHGEITKTYNAKTLNSAICSEETLNKVKILLEGVVERGTAAKYVKSESFKIAGKTGTSEIAVGKTGYHTEDGVFNNASFAGYFPAENPKYSCIVLISKPRRFSSYGGSVAGPVFKEIAEKLFATDYEMQNNKIFDVANMPNNNELPESKYGSLKLLNTIFYNLNILTKGKIDNDKRWIKTSVEDNKIVYSEFEHDEIYVPDVCGMGARDAIFILENKGLEVVLKGRGSVKKQSLVPGRKIRENDKIILTLEI